MEFSKNKGLIFGTVAVAAIIGFHATSVEGMNEPMAESVVNNLQQIFDPNYQRHIDNDYIVHLLEIMDIDHLHPPTAEMQRLSKLGMKDGEDIAVFLVRFSRESDFNKTYIRLQFLNALRWAFTYFKIMPLHIKAVEDLIHRTDGYVAVCMNFGSTESQPYTQGSEKRFLISHLCENLPNENSRSAFLKLPPDFCVEALREVKRLDFMKDTGAFMNALVDLLVEAQNTVNKSDILAFETVFLELLSPRCLDDVHLTLLIRYIPAASPGMGGRIRELIHCQLNERFIAAQRMAEECGVNLGPQNRRPGQVSDSQGPTGAASKPPTAAGSQATDRRSQPPEERVDPAEIVVRDKVIDQLQQKLNDLQAQYEFAIRRHAEETERLRRVNPRVDQSTAESLLARNKKLEAEKLDLTDENSRYQTFLAEYARGHLGDRMFVVNTPVSVRFRQNLLDKRLPYKVSEPVKPLLGNLKNVLDDEEGRGEWIGGPVNEPGVAFTVTYPPNVTFQPVTLVIRSTGYCQLRTSLRIEARPVGTSDWVEIGQTSQVPVGLRRGNGDLEVSLYPSETRFDAFRVFVLGKNSQGTFQLHLSKFVLVGNYIHEYPNLGPRRVARGGVLTVEPQPAFVRPLLPPAFAAAPHPDGADTPLVDEAAPPPPPPPDGDAGAAGIRPEADQIPSTAEVAIEMPRPPAPVYGQAPLPTTAADLVAVTRFPPTLLRARTDDGPHELDVDLFVGYGDLPRTRQPLITEMTGLVDVRELGSSRFGAIRLVRRPNLDVGGDERFAAKFYNTGDNRDIGEAFWRLVHPFPDFDHPCIEPIVGIVPPTKKGKGPIVLAPFSPGLSLEDVLVAERRNDPPAFWTRTAKVNVAWCIGSGLHYLHSKGVVHRELKPSDIIITIDEGGNVIAQVSGSLTSVLEEHKYARTTQVGGPSYMAPEVYNDEAEGRKERDQKTDVFSYGLILFEIFGGRKVFPSTISAAAIMRRAMSNKPADRPKFADGAPNWLQKLFIQATLANPARRPTVFSMLCTFNKNRFAFFPDMPFTMNGPTNPLTGEPVLQTDSDYQVSEAGRVMPSAGPTHEYF
ncbi:MAG: protein kinase [Lactobacillales bacterium]|jgi:hypothetical protein|nr:protein kinase [Lactobacillales bacterium]